MNEYDELYDLFARGQEVQKREKFSIFMNGLVEGLTKDLDDSYAGIGGIVQRSGKTINYETLLSNVKAQGFKVFRNSQGKHKLKISDPTALNTVLPFLNKI